MSFYFLKGSIYLWRERDGFFIQRFVTHSLVEKNRGNDKEFDSNVSLKTDFFLLLEISRKVTIN